MLRSLVSAAIGLLVLGSACFARTDPNGSPLAKVQFKRQEMDDLARILQIKKLAGTYELRSEVNTVRLRLDFYRKGEKLPVQMTKPGISGGSKPLGKTGGFLVQIIDLDYLRLGDGQPGHWRIHADVSVAGSTSLSAVMSSTKLDLAKDAFTASASAGGTGTFPNESGEQHEAPIFWMATGKTRNAKTAKELLEVNKDCDLIIGYLEFR